MIIRIGIINYYRRGKNNIIYQTMMIIKSWYIVIVIYMICDRCIHNIVLNAIK